MTKVYNLWLYIEEADEENNSYEDIDLPIKLGQLKTPEEAIQYGDRLKDQVQINIAMSHQEIL